MLVFNVGWDTGSSCVCLLPRKVLSCCLSNRFLQDMADFWETTVLSTVWSNPEQTQLDRSMPVPRPFYPGVFFSQMNGFGLLTHFDLTTLWTHDSVGSLFIGVYIGASRLPTLLLFLAFYGTTAMCLFFPICLFYFSYRFSISFPLKTLKNKIFILLVFPLVSLVFIYFCLLLFSSPTYSFRSLLFYICACSVNTGSPT